MRSHLVRAAVWAVIALGLLVPSSPLAARPQDDLSKAPRITLQEFKKLRAEGQVVVVDVRDVEAFKDGHIPGALSIPLDEVTKHIDELKSYNKPIVTYCA